MPAFILITGYFSSFNAKKLLTSLVCPYILFQVLYQLFDLYVLNPGRDFSLQFTTPYWLLWYLLVLIFYNLLIPLIDTSVHRYRVLLIIGSVVLSLLAGYDMSIGYYMSLSRFFTFLPYFLIGYYCGHPLKDPGSRNLKWIRILSPFALLMAAVYIWKSPNITSQVLYGSYSYSSAGYNPCVKLFLMVVALIWILFLLAWIPNIKFPVISSLGQNTFPVFLLHGFFIRLLGTHSIFSFSVSLNLLLAVLLSLIIILLMANRYFTRFFTGRWLLK